MTNQIAIAINRTVPMLHQAAELHEEIQAQLPKWRDIGGELMTKAKAVGQALESAHLSLKSSGVSVSWDEVLAAHAPNIEPKQCDKYRRFSRGEITDPRQLCMLGFEVKQLTEHSDQEPRDKPEIWERAWGYAYRFSRIMREVKVDRIPKVQVEGIKRELEPIAKALWPEKFTGSP